MAQVWGDQQVAQGQHRPRAGAMPLHVRLARQLEAEYDRWFLWLPVLFGAGIAFYFALPSEPLLTVAVLPAVAALAVHAAGPRTGLMGLATGAMLAVTLGVAAAKVRTEIVRAPVLQRRVGPIDVYGFVELVEPRAGARASASPSA